jgi:hexosaminidase
VTEPALIPRPAGLTAGSGYLRVGDRTEILADAESHAAAALLAALLPPVAGAPRPVGRARSQPGHDTIALAVDGTRSDLGSEGYELTVTPRHATLTGSDPRGVVWGVQTVRQLLALDTGQAASLPAVTIRDQPSFAWRGLHLDVVRHFFPVAFLERLLDLMALYKLNTFHWHLTDDQGWRVEVRSRPRLTEVGARRSATPLPHDRHQSDGTPYSGHYTQDQVRQVVAYAAARGITVVPEIEMPGHALAALASYPELGCRGAGYEVGTSWGIKSEVLCAGRESTFSFLEEVLSEVLELFPSPFIHVGGDECPKQSWRACPHCQARRAAEGLRDEDELQSWFIRRMGEWLAARGRRLVGWDEILEGGLAAGATVMSWRGIDGGVAAAASGHDVVMSPNTHCYFDYYQSRDTAAEPPAIGGHLPLEQVYDFDPIPAAIAGAHAGHVLGVQGNIWTEYIATPAQVEYMAFPRALALAEVGWTPAARRSAAHFQERLRGHLPLLDRLGVHYRPWPGG